MATLTNFMKRWHHIYLYICLSIISFSSILILYWEFYPIKILEITGPVILQKSEYTAGDRLTYTFSYCKYQNLVGTAFRSLINGTRTSFTPMEGNMPLGCHTVQISDLVIPDYMDADTYHLEATIEYQLNPIRKVDTSWKSNNFIIKRNKKI